MKNARTLDIIKTADGRYLYGESFQFTNGEWGFAIRGDAPGLNAALAYIEGYAKHSTEPIAVDIVSELVASEIAELREFNVFKDGDQWCATDQSFINLQESPAGFGKSHRRAISALLTELNRAKVPA